MAVLKLIKKPYRDDDVINNLVGYALNQDKMINMCYGGSGVSIENPIESMYAMKKALNLPSGKQAEHFILAFNQKELSKLTIPLIKQIAYDICEYFQGIQVVFALHEINNDYYSTDEFDSDKPHIHFVLNTVNAYTGGKFYINYNNEFDIRNYIEYLLFFYNISDKVTLSVK